MKKITQFIVLASLIDFTWGAQQVLAADAGKFYVGADLGSSQVSGDGPENNEIFAPSQEFKASDTSYRVYAGFQFNDWFAVELGYTDFGNASQRFKLKDGVVFIVQPNDTQTLEAKGTSLSGIFNYQLAADLSLFGVVGVVTMDYAATESGGFSPITGSLLAKRSFSDQGLVYGVGGKYALNDSLSLRADLRRHDVGDFTLDLATFGIEYSF